MVPFQNFETSDGWIVVACPKEKFWRSLCGVLGRDDLLGDPRLQDFAGRHRHRHEVVAAVAHELRSRPTREWLAALGEAGVPCAQVNDVMDALQDQQATARGAVVEVEHPRFGVVREVGSPLRVDGASRAYRRAPARDEHREDVLRRVCGYDDETIRERAAAGAFGEPR
jgi:crotonobetainyl-CoA:carnitine CoA-transferase CaiB-like acyl-CoA transferase